MGHISSSDPPPTTLWGVAALVGESILLVNALYMYTPLIHAEVDRGRPIYKSLLGGEYIDEEMEEKLKVLSNPDMLDSKKGRHSSLQNRKAKTKSVAKTKK